MAVLCLVAAAPAGGEESALDFIQPRLDRLAYAELKGELELDRDQQTIVELLFTDYMAAITDLVTRADAEADEAGRDRVRDALQGRIRLAPDELRQLRAGVLQVYQSKWLESDALLQGFLEGAESILLEEQRLRADRAFRDLRRELWLRPRRAGSSFPEYAGDGVDVVLLVAEARAPGGELADVPARALEEMIEAYTEQMDLLLEETAVDDRAGAMRLRIARIQRDRQAEQLARQAALERWKRLYELNQRTVGRIQDLLEPERARDWQDRFDRESFPWLLEPGRPDRQYEWISRQTLSPEVAERTRNVYQNYCSRRRGLAGQAISLMLQGRIQLRALFYPTMDARALRDPAALRLYEQLLKNSGELENLDKGSAQVLEAVLPADLREQMRRALR